MRIKNRNALVEAPKSSKLAVFVVVVVVVAKLLKTKRQINCAISVMILSKDSASSRQPLSEK